MVSLVVFHKATEAVVKKLPLMVNVKAALPVTAEDGLRLLIAGGG